MTAPDPERPRSEREALATLLPCPWCGELPDVRQRKRGRPIRYFTEVICTNMPDCPVLASVSDREEAVAIAAWNRRAGWRRDGGEDTPMPTRWYCSSCGEVEDCTTQYGEVVCKYKHIVATFFPALSAGRPIPTEEK